ncbi:universal stress protein [Saccharothrix longispora]|uniref:universal stress protein n=1 Tax=Saccharothrix longispora TaxID=33920 RepID=UPI0028FD603F|nr:universal stress protein [Saccharothrix longispora]MBY8850892.1 universal stress protein [Saccharothrix sp. MB29]MDU0292323.1 universal stress protein [Saccharothrix longispora]
MGEPVVVGIDGSEEALGAVRWAAGEAARLHAPLRLVHVRPRPAPHSDRWDHEVDERGLRWLERAAREVPPGVEVGTELVRGRPAPVLTARTHHARLVVLGARPDGVATGAVLVPVVAHAACPVVVVRHGGDGPVVVGVDVTASDEPVLAFAFDAASARGVPLRAVAATSARGAGDALVEHLAAQHDRHPEVPVELVVVPDGPVWALVGASRGAGLLVVGTRDHSAFVGALLGSTSQGLVLHAPCPLAVVPHSSPRRTTAGRKSLAAGT